MIPIVVTIDDKYTQHLGVMLASLFENNKDLEFHIFVFYDVLEDASKNALSNFCAEANHKITFQTVSTKNIQDFQVRVHATLANYFRILAFEQLPADIEKILYLDTDILVLKSIDALWETDLGSNILGTVPNSGEVKGCLRLLNIPDSKHYFNSGVMLVNIKQWKKENMTSRVLQFIVENPDKIRFWDQDALNAICYEHSIYLDKIWNVQAPDIMHSKSKSENYKKARILHFTGMSKPWQYMNKHPYKKLYYKYLKLTPWKGYKPEDKTIGNFLRKYKIIK